MFPTAKYIDLLDELQGVCASVVPEEFFPTPQALDEQFTIVKEQFAAEYERAFACDEIMLNEDITGFGARATAIFTFWEEQGGGPSLPALLAVVAEHWGLDIASPAVKAAFVAGVMAEIPNIQYYHGNEHYRKVLFHTIRLMATHNDMFPDDDLTLTDQDKALFLTASSLHDLGHEGGDNVRDGVYTPGYLEQKSCDYARPYLEAVGLDYESYGTIETMVFCTDITFFAGENSPCIRMKKIYDYYFNGIGDDDEVAMMMMGKLRRFEDNKKLALMAMMLHEADVACSAGMSYEWTIKETQKFMEERCMDMPMSKIILAFLNEQLGSTLFTAAGQAIYGTVMTHVIEAAEKELQAGR